MKYKVRDKVKIKIFKDINRVMRGKKKDSIYFEYTQKMEDNINELFSDREVVIKEVGEDFYVIGNTWFLDEDMIECLAKEYRKKYYINDRFEILDL